MIEIGRINSLRVCKETDQGVYLDGENQFGEILLPTRYVPDDYEETGFVDVFIYFDSEDRIIATTETPLGMVGQFAWLKVVAVTPVGAFLDWGLPKDILVPFREQKVKLTEGQYCLAFIYLDDESNRLVASCKSDKFLDNIPPEYSEGEEVEVIIAQKTDLGYKAIINHTHWGMLYANEVFKELNAGETHTAYIKKVREDEKIDLSLTPPGVEKFDELGEAILAKLSENEGFLPLHDKSDAQEISKVFGVSKKLFKRTIGNLYKKKAITITKEGINLPK